MKISTSICLVGCMILMFSARRTEGVRCYFCTGSGCGDEFNQDRQQIIECRGSCSKMKTDDDYVTRACVPLMNRNTGCRKYSDSVHCFCTGDLCNAGPPRNTGSAVVVSLLATICAILKLM